MINFQLLSNLNREMIFRIISIKLTKGKVLINKIHLPNSLRITKYSR